VRPPDRGAEAPGSEDGGGPASRREPDHNDDSATAKHLNTASVNRRTDGLAALRRRREAALRLPPLGPSCGCIRDPLFDRHRCGRENDEPDRWGLAR
jgi:hypothetical protein